MVDIPHGEDLSTACAADAGTSVIGLVRKLATPSVRIFRCAAAAIVVVMVLVTVVMRQRPPTTSRRTGGRCQTRVIR